MRTTAVLGSLVGVAVLAAGCSSSTGGTPHQGGPTTTLVCKAASGDAGQDTTALRKRLDDLSGDIVSVDANGSTVTVKVRGLTAGVVRPVCTRGELSLRPVVAPAEDSVKCTTPDLTTPPSAPLEACDATGRRYTLAVAVVSGTDVTDATAVAPGSGSGDTWTVRVTLSAAAGKRFAAYTSAHNSGGAGSASTATTCGPGTVPCADFMGIVVDGVVVSLPLTIAAITGGQVQLAGNFTRLSARSLATQLKSGPLPVPLRFVSVK